MMKNLGNEGFGLTVGREKMTGMIRERREMNELEELCMRSLSK